MAKYVVKYYLPNGEKYQLEVQAYNVFHAEKLETELLYINNFKSD